MTATARKLIPWRFWPLNSFSHGRATRPVRATDVPMTSSPEMSGSATVTVMTSAFPFITNRTSTVTSALPVSWSVAISPVRRSLTLGCGGCATIAVADEVSTGI